MTAAATPSSEERLIGFDALRSIMLLLGIVIHTVYFYAPTDIFPRPFASVDQHRAYDIMVMVIHAFRMPVFMVMAGYFGLLVLTRKGTSTFLRDRTRRVVVPLLFGWLLVAPVLKLLVAHLVRGVPWNELLASITSLRIYIGLPLFHLWFLYYLTILYALVILLRMLPAGWRRAMWRPLDALMASGGRHVLLLLTLSMLSSAFILSGGTGTIPTEIGWSPNGGLLLLYAGYFGYGMALYRNRARMRTLMAAWRWYIPITVVLAGVHVFFAWRNEAGNGGVDVVWASLSCGMLSWAAVVAFIGLFDHVMRPAAWITYLCEASLCIYLIHVPIVFWLAFISDAMPVPHPVRVTLVMLCTLLISLCFYHFLVRRTWLGLLLNGRRSQRSTHPAPSPALAQ